MSSAAGHDNKTKRFADIFSCREKRFEKTYFAEHDGQVMTSTFDAQYRTSASTCARRT